MAGISASYQRRQEEWDHQADLAQKDMDRFDVEIEAAKTRLEIAKSELENHEKQYENALEVSNYLQEKFSNEELYEWMLEQASVIHFNSYLLAIDIARQAESCFHYERIQDNTKFIKCEEWSSLQMGLLAGERLQQDLRRMEVSYLAGSTREFELRKSISLALVDPVAAPYAAAAG